MKGAERNDKSSVQAPRGAEKDNDHKSLEFAFIDAPHLPLIYITRTQYAIEHFSQLPSKIFPIE